MGKMKKKVQIILALLIAGVHVTKAQWTEQATGYTAVSRGVKNISIVDENTVWVSANDGSGAGAAVNEFSRTVDGGTTWTPGSVTEAAGMNISCITAVDANTAWAAFSGTSGGKVFKTTDGGTTWTHQASATFAAPDGFPNIIHFFDANNGVCQGDPNGGYFEIYTTSDGGDTWTRVPQNNIPASTGDYGLAPIYTAGHGKIWFGTYLGNVFYSSDSGKTWGSGSTGLTQVSALAFKDADNGLALHRQTQQLAKTTDGGATWSLVTTTGDLLPNWVAHVPGTNAYLSTGSTTGLLGTSVSTDDGSTWTRVDSVAQHTSIAFYSPTVGWTGGFNSSATVGGIYKWTGDLANYTSLSDQADFLKPEIYPNPARNFIVLENIPSKAVVEVYNVYGKLVHAQQIANSKITLDIADYSKGIYLVQVKAGDLSVNKKIVVQ